MTGETDLPGRKRGRFPLFSTRNHPRKADTFTHPLPNRRKTYDGSCQDVAVVWVGQGKGRDQVFVARHDAVTDRLVHQDPRSRQTLGRQAWMVLEEITHPLLMDRVRPPGTHESRLREPDEQVTQRGQVKDVRVVDGGDGLLPQ